MWPFDKKIEKLRKEFQLEVGALWRESARHEREVHIRSPAKSQILDELIAHDVRLDAICKHLNEVDERLAEVEFDNIH